MAGCRSSFHEIWRQRQETSERQSQGGILGWEPLGRLSQATVGRSESQQHTCSEWWPCALRSGPPFVKKYCISSREAESSLTCLGSPAGHLQPLLFIIPVARTWVQRASPDSVRLLVSALSVDDHRLRWGGHSKSWLRPAPPRTHRLTETPAV